MEFNRDDAKIGNYSVAFGKNTTASAIGSAALGENTKAEGSNSVALGRETIAKAYLSLAIGKFNVGSGVSAGTWNNNDPVFEIGDGADDANRSNIADGLLKNGNLESWGLIPPPHDFTRLEGW